MCGISGIIGLSNRQESDRIIRAMNDALSHRGPDAEGFYVEDKMALGHRRLSIIDLSTAANQPFFDPTGRYVLVFNGEIYNYQDIRTELTGYPFRTNSDTEVILAAYIQWGPDCLSKLKGMFAFALWDKTERKLFIARDRFGVKPLYYYHQDGYFLFSSEIRSLLSSKLIPRKLNKQALSDYLKYQSVITPFTLVEHIKQLPAGHYMLYSSTDLMIRKYWDITEVTPLKGGQDPEVVKKSVRDLLFQSVERRLVSDVPVGAFLSGGIDSSAIVAIMSKVSRQKPVAFTVGFDEKEYDETAYAELIAKKYDVTHHKVKLRPDDFLHELPHALDALDTPSGDGINTYVVSKAIRQSGIKVALSGVGGDELFVGYPIFHQFKKLQKFQTLFRSTSLLRKILAGIIPAGNQKDDRIKAILSSRDVSIASVYPLLRQIQTNAQIRQLTGLNDRPEQHGTLEKHLIENIGRLKAFDAYSQVSIADYWGYTQHVLLKDTDQMSMAVALEIREPFFDHDLVEYVVSLPDSCKGIAYPKQLLVESLKPLVPDEVVFRKKQGFVLPYDVWMRNELKTFCDDKIRSLASRDYFNGPKLSSYWQDFLENKSKIRWADMWILIVLENWLQANGIE